MATPIVVPKLVEKEYLSTLNDRFASYISRVRQMRELSGRNDTVNFMNSTKILEEEITALKAMYERQLEELRHQLEDLAKDRTQQQLAAAKNSALVAELQDKLGNETSNRKKVENALADAHRVIADKEALLQDARVTTTQHQNAHMDTTRERDGLQTALTQTQQALDTEMAARVDLQTNVNQLREKLGFEQQLHEKEMAEIRARLNEADQTILLAEERLHEHNIIDENLAAMLAKVKLHSQHELRRFKEESEISHQNSMNQLKIQLDNESRNLASATDDNIHMKAHIESLQSKIINLDAKCSSLEAQNSSLIQSLEMERQQAANTIKNLEAKLRELQEALMAKVRELGLAYNAHVPLDLELGAFATLLEAEERRLSLALQNQAPLAPVRSRTWHTITPRSKTLTTEPKRPASTLGITPSSVSTSTKIHTPIARPKTTAGTLSVSRTVPPVVEPVTTASPYRHTWSYVPNFIDYHSPTSSHTGNVRILEVNPDGNYVRLFNTSAHRDEEIGGYMVQQNVSGRPVTVFRFPPRTRLKALSHTTVWSAGSLMKHNPPSDFLWKEQHKWGTGPECTTILCKPNGQAVAWTTAAFPFGVPNQIPTRDTGPGSPRDTGLDREPSREPKSPRSKNPEPPPREIENKSFSRSPNDPLHPHAVQTRVKTGGHDGMTMNPQSRSQTVRPDPAGASRTGGAPLRRYAGSSLPNDKDSSPKQGHGGTIRVMPSSEFTSPKQNYQDRLSNLTTQQRVNFSPPPPRPYVASR
ncbi:lamin-B1-like [Actinia tenebrosa]|uniref:Lamin-B1-like n=1 Tax=Actinia tenebrosa TaxID=6105 RepID=A0A6P8GY73_ACTTE|nr:lamin-B1-like [Actinia tenebrosa]